MMDEKSSEILSQYQKTLLDPSSSSVDNNDTTQNSDTDSLIDLLDDDDDPAMAAYREQRVQQLSQEFKESKLRASDAASVETLTNESQMFDMIKSMDSSSLSSAPGEGGSSTTSSSSSSNTRNRKSKYRSIVVHFFHPEFTTCKLLDSCFSELASRHYNSTKFVRINAVTDAPFLTAKFSLRVLPAVLAFREGKPVIKYIGLDKFIAPRLLAKLSAEQQSQASQNPGSGFSGLKNLKSIDVDWVEQEFINKGILFRKTKQVGKDDSENNDDDKYGLRSRGIRSGKQSSWTSSKRENNTYNDESDDDDGLDI